MKNPLFIHNQAENYIEPTESFLNFAKSTLSSGNFNAFFTKLFEILKEFVISIITLKFFIDILESIIEKIKHQTAFTQFLNTINPRS